MLEEQRPELREDPVDEDQDYVELGPPASPFPDLTIKEEVLEALTFQEDIGEEDIQVDVKRGVVFLTGAVKNSTEKELAGETADGIDDVIDVVNGLRVKEGGHSSHPL